MWHRLRRWWQSDRQREDAWQAGFDFGVGWVYGSDSLPEPPARFDERLAAQWQAGFRIGHHVSMDETQLEIHRRRRPHQGRRSS